MPSVRARHVLLPQTDRCFLPVSCLSPPPSPLNPRFSSPLKFQWADLMAKGALIPKNEGRWRGRLQPEISFLPASDSSEADDATLHVQLTGWLPRF